MTVFGFISKKKLLEVAVEVYNLEDTAFATLSPAVVPAERSDTK